MTERSLGPAFGRLVKFAEAFPTVQRIKVTVREMGDGVRSGEEVHYATPEHGGIGETIPCSNTRCRGGGIHIGPILREMVKGKETERLRDAAHCMGKEGRRREICYTTFGFDVLIEYKQE